jgi:hypothetical protein
MRREPSTFSPANRPHKSHRPCKCALEKCKMQTRARHDARSGTFTRVPLHSLIAQKHRCAASRIVSVRRCRRRRTALASCACASKQCSFSTADRLLWLDQSQRRRRCLQRCACEISASPDSECAVSESRKALHCATILHAHELTSCASSSAGTKPCR